MALKSAFISRRESLRNSVEASPEARSNKNFSTIDQAKPFVMDEKTQKKLYGNLSVKDVADFHSKNLLSDDQLGIKGYHYDPNLRFNFHNKKHKVPEAKMRRVFDILIDREKKLPGPCSYKSTQHRTHFNDITKKSTIYTQDR